MQGAKGGKNNRSSLLRHKSLRLPMMCQHPQTDTECYYSVKVGTAFTTRCNTRRDNDSITLSEYYTELVSSYFHFWAEFWTTVNSVSVVVRRVRKNGTVTYLHIFDKSVPIFTVLANNCIQVTSELCEDTTL